LPEHGLAVRETQIALCHAMLDSLFEGRITLCDAGVGIGKDHAFVDINNSGMPKICEWIEKNGLGEATGRQQKSGFGVYPEYHFDARRLKELERGGCEGYAAGLQQRGRSAKSNSRPVR
jgi:hypothetical protein